MNPEHHLNRSNLYLRFSRTNAAVGDYHRAAGALTRAASHAATAAAVHWHHRHYSRRRLNTALGGLLFDGLIRLTHLRTFREVYSLPAQVAAAPTPNSARRILRTARRRVLRLLAAVSAAMSLRPNPPTLDDVLARIAAEGSAALPPPPPVTTIGELGRALGEYVPAEYADHPLSCYGCYINYHETTPPPDPF